MSIKVTAQARQPQEAVQLEGGRAPSSGCFASHAKAAPAAPAHPIEALQATMARERRGEAGGMTTGVAQATYGLGFGVRARMETHILGRLPLRLPGLGASHAALETLLGYDDDIDYADYLGPDVTRDSFDLHEVMEAQLGL
eukprot:m51a1_g7783 hypothetical protein (141) ;mRNA; r:233706-234299